MCSPHCGARVLQVNRRGAVRVAFSPGAASCDAAEFAALARQLGPDGVACGGAVGAAEAAWHWCVRRCLFSLYRCLQHAVSNC
jgi:hypothetical protein